MGPIPVLWIVLLLVFLASTGRLEGVVNALRNLSYEG